MKKLFILTLISALMLCGCTVGPEEGPRVSLSTPDAGTFPAEQGPPMTTLPEEQEPAPPVDIEEPEPMPPVNDEEPAVTEPDEPIEEPVTTPDIEYDVDLYETPRVMYPTISLNVRSGPSVDFESIGSLSEGAPTEVIGIASTGWYLIEYRGENGYVSGSYMTDEDPNPEPEPEPRPEYPQLDPLDHAAKAAIASDYEAAYGFEEGSAYVASYYGAYSGGDAVVMWRYDPAFLPDEQIGIPSTADIKEFTVGGHDFILGSGSYSITIHTADGQFIDLADAYAQGLVTDEELGMISYYNQN